MKYLERYRISLKNPLSAEIAMRDPLAEFSFYLSGRVSTLFHFAEEIIENLDSAFEQDSLRFEDLHRAESLMWLWLMGAYEVVRTMTQASSCFSSRAQEDLRILKKQLAAARMPATKMEVPGKRIPVTSNRNPANIDPENRDLLVGSPDSLEQISARNLFSEFDRVFCAITVGDILAEHESSYT